MLTEVPGNLGAQGILSVTIIAENPRVSGSIPEVGTIYFLKHQKTPATAEVTGVLFILNCPNLKSIAGSRTIVINGLI